MDVNVKNNTNCMKAILLYARMPSIVSPVFLELLLRPKRVLGGEEGSSSVLLSWILPSDSHDSFSESWL